MTSTPKQSRAAGNHDNCNRCGSAENFPKLTGLCPACLLAAAVKGISAEDHPALGSIAITGPIPTVESLNAEFPDFEFHELLGRGGSGWTFLATQKKLNRPVAVKLMKVSASTSTESQERFKQEAGILSQLNHPHIVTVYDFGSTERFLYIVMESVPGDTLRKQTLSAPVDPDRVVEIGHQICKALEFAHSKGLVHRDIKPENILIASDDPEIEIRVADFGISRMTPGHQTRAGLTSTGLIMGTPFYMAPEQQVPSLPVDHRCDIYSTGVVLYELLTGRLPQGNFPPPSQLAECNQHVDKVILKALSNDPKNRFDSAAKFSRRLRIANQSTGTPWTAKKTWLVLAAATVALFVGTLIWMETLGDRGETVAAQKSSENTSKNDSEKIPADESDSPGDSRANTTVDPVPAEVDVEGLEEMTEPEEPSDPLAVVASYQSLIDDLNSDDVRAKREALQTILKVPPPTRCQPVIDAVRKALDSSDTWVKQAALPTLVAIDPEGCIDDLIASLDADTFMRRRALEQIVLLNDPRMIGPVGSHLGSSDHRYFVSVLVELGSESEGILCEFLIEDDSWMTMKPAVEALAEIGTEASLDTLRQMQNSHQSFIPKEATLAIEKIEKRSKRLKSDRMLNQKSDDPESF